MRSSSSLWINPAPLWGPSWRKTILSWKIVSSSGVLFLETLLLSLCILFLSSFWWKVAPNWTYKWSLNWNTTFCTGGLKLRDLSVGNRCLCLAASMGRLRPRKSPCGLVHTHARGARHEYRGADQFRMQNISCSWRCRFPGASSLSKRTESLMVLRC